ncbi:MAG: BLUF domain-containing protein [Planctomycetota bacterium]
MLHRVLYVSTAAHRFDEPSVARLAERSSAKNRLLDVTGVLIYGRGQFMQLLEGPKDNVRAVMRTINEDPRHFNILTVIDEPTSVRLFDSWGMGHLAIPEPTSDSDQEQTADAERPCSAIAAMLESGPGDVIFGILRHFRDKAAVA